MHRYFLFNRKRTAVPPVSITHTSCNGLTEEETSTQLLAGIENLPDKYKEVIVLHYIENKTINEIKATIGMSASTVRNRLSYGLFLLNKYLSDKLNTHA